MITTIGGVPVKTRVPLAVWGFAGFLTLISMASSLVNNTVGSSVVSAAAAKHSPTAAGDAGVTWASMASSSY